MTVQSVPDARGSSSRDRLLAAGSALLTKHPNTLIKRGITADLVSIKAGVARRTFYAQFETIDDYTTALAASLEHQSERLVPPAAVTLTDSRGDLRIAIDKLLTAELAYLTEFQMLSRALTLLGKAARTPVNPSANWNSLIDELIALGLHAGPTEIDQILGAIDRLVLGHLEQAHQAGATPDLHSTAGWAIELLLSSMLDPATEDDADALASRRTRIQQTWTESAASLSIPNVSHLVLRAAETVIERSGIRALTIEAIARTTGLSRSSITRYVGAPERILEALLDEHTPGLAVAAERDLAGGADQAVARRNHYTRLLTLLRERPAYAQACLWQLADNRPAATGAGRALAWINPLLLGDEEASALDEQLLSLAIFVTARSDIPIETSAELLARLSGNSLQLRTDQSSSATTEFG